MNGEVKYKEKSAYSTLRGLATNEERFSQKYNRSLRRMLESRAGAVNSDKEAGTPESGVEPEGALNTALHCSLVTDLRAKQIEVFQGTVEETTMHQKGKAVVYMEDQDEPEDSEPVCAGCGKKGLKTYQYQMCKPCLTKKLRGIQDFIDEQRKEIFGDR